jgi:hypothetical protein
MKNVKVTQMSSNRTGEAVKNQMIIETSDGRFFQSYDSIIAVKRNNGSIELDSRYWDYSKTTGKYRNQFLNEKREETQKKIDSGIYKLVDLNS